MRSTIVLFLTIIFIHYSCYSQTKAKISNVDFHLEERYIVVNYNITGSLPKEQMTIELKFITESNETIVPKTVTGDVGTKLFGDGMKTILWDIVADQVSLSGNIKTSVTITNSKILYKGPSYALLSVLVPGLGGYCVDENKTRSVLTTISTVGLITYGIIQKHQADKYYAEYNASTVPDDIQSLYSKANEAQHNYFISTRVAAGIWALDIIWVTYKGIRNRNEAKSAYNAYSGDGIRLYYVNNGMQIGYTVTF
jgi:hypothetical protein